MKIGVMYYPTVALFVERCLGGMEEGKGSTAADIHGGCLDSETGELK